MKSAVLSIREEAAERFRELGYPTTRIEEWKYTNVSPIAKVQWSAARPGTASAAQDPRYANAIAELVFVNGQLVARK